ncbi:MAG TPA: Smr/MutS family protein, partial [Chloroflexota bacterium]|nr:Smr/MutS family protein [Chloroflexota bacterium]
ARHPLLSGDVVPIDVALDQVIAPGERDDADGTRGPGEGEEPVPQAGTPKDYIALVITGPNTGGKTVALKTVGLLQLMAQAGMHLPVAEGSSVAVFDQIFADIGDEQSIEQSLSTFSSHMSNIVRILGRVDGGCLVLLDELGAGTDPEEGSALARAILSYLVERDVRTVATTHYSELKAYAYATPLVQNASVEFDVETLRPTYRLITGLPGRSNALAIAQRLGLPQPILDAARSMVRAEEAQIEDLLAGIQAERDAAQAARQEADRLREVAQTAQAAAERRLDEIEEERISLLEGARREAAGELETARQQIRRAEGRVAAAGGDRMEVLRATREVQDAAEALAAQPVPRRRGPAPARAPDERPIEVGDRVELRRLNAVGQVLSGPNERGEVEVQLGNLRTRANVRELTRVTRREADALQTAAARGPAGAPRGAAGWGGVPEGRSSRSEPAVRLPAPRDVRLEIDVRGSRADEVLPRVEQYLSDAYLSGMPFVRVIHGKGTGVLRQIIRDHLAQSQLVQSYESAGPSDGGDGATIVKLAV